MPFPGVVAHAEILKTRAGRQNHVKNFLLVCRFIDCVNLKRIHQYEGLRQPPRCRQRPSVQLDWLQSIKRVSASWYLAAVFSITSRGKRGEGGVLSQG